LAQLATNREWNGRSIMPDDYGGRKPDSQRFWPDASSASRGITRWLNNVTGGDEFEPGWIDVSPETLDHLTKFVATGVFNELWRASKEVHRQGYAALTGEQEEVLLRNVPILRRFYRQRSPFGSHAEFRDIRNDLLRERDRASQHRRRMEGRTSALLAESRKLERIRLREQSALADMSQGSPERIERTKVLDRQLQKFIKKYWNEVRNP
jgi:hypothetical protein